MPQRRKSNLGKNTRNAVALRSRRASEIAGRRARAAASASTAIASETAERRRALNAASTSTTRAAETAEQSQRRRSRNAASTSTTRASETAEQSQRRRSRNAASTSTARAAETADQRATRLAADSKRKLRPHVFPRVSLSDWSNKGFQYSPEENYASHPHMIIGSMSTVCDHCNALRWPAESTGICCSHGTVRLPPLKVGAEPLTSLLLGDHPLSKHFLSNIRAYNSAFQMTSFGHQAIHHGRHMFTFKVQGQIYHHIGSLLPQDDCEHRFLQIYFMGNGPEEVSRRDSLAPTTKSSLLQSLQDMFHTVNPYVTFFKTALQRRASTTNEFKVVIRADRAPSGQHQGCFNRPQTDEVAVLITGAIESSSRRDIVLEWQDSRLKRINELHPAYDALQYVVLFPFGDDGYGIDIPKCNPVTLMAVQPLKTVSQMQFYSFRLMVRKDENNLLHRARMLLNQYCVDIFAKVDTERLQWIQNHQKELRAEEYGNLRDEVNRNDQLMATDVGLPIILPSTYTGGPRYMHEKMQDALTYVRYYGRPDLFITFTCNPKWTEIRSHLFDGQQPSDRHDIVSRVFHLKLNKMIDVFRHGQLFGAVRCYTYNVEWQKRGLPHAHILLWLHNKIKSTDVDSVISAELPHPQEDPILYDIIKSNMIHGPCGHVNRKASCMDNGKCMKRYPRPLIAETKTGHDGYPLYRRRSPQDGGHTAIISTVNGQQITIDNRWVVPHNKVLCRLFEGHINVEVCNSVKSIKYIFKYVNKGSDRAVFELARTDSHNVDTDEVISYQTGRYISSNEAFWRLFGFPIHEREPAVIHLSVHLENGQRVYFNEVTMLDCARVPRDSTLTGFFALCTSDYFARTLLYPEVPTFYTWNNSSRIWQRRKRGRISPRDPSMREADVLSRVYTVHPLKSECFHLRHLLHVIKGPTCFDDLRIVNGERCSSFKETCSKLGLLENDEQYDRALQEASALKSPKALRRLFAVMLVFCSLENPQALWDRYRDSMCLDILMQVRYNSSDVSLPFTLEIYNRGLMLVEDTTLHIGGLPLKSYCVQSPNRQNDDVCNRHLLMETCFDTSSLLSYVREQEHQLNAEQADVYNLVSSMLESNTGGIVFLDAPGGTGKTFLLNLLLAKVRQQGQIAVAMASSGIAATLLESGRTVHSTFKLPLNIGRVENPSTNIRKNSEEAVVFKKCALIVWDEATMSHRNAFDAINATLQDLRSNSQPFGGVVMLLAGDFRQTLPIVPKGHPGDEIEACIKHSHLWRFVQTKRLTINMRSIIHGREGDEDFAEKLLDVGNGNLLVDGNGLADISSIGNYVSGPTELCQTVYPELSTNYSNHQWLCERAILAPTNVNVQSLNNCLLRQLPTQERTYASVDSITDPAQVMVYPTEFLNSQDPSGMPPHKLCLTVGSPIILLRNLEPPRLCNGTRLVITQMLDDVLEAKVITGKGAGETVFICRMPLIPTDCVYPMKRVQFPIRLSFAMTINKAQGQSLKVVGMDLSTPCFSHGQLYVGCSRVGSSANLFYYTPGGLTRNVVYKAALQ